MFKKLSLLSAAMFGAIAMTGCGGNYPSEVMFDTKQVREAADIKEISGEVFAAKTGVAEAYSLIDKESSAIYTSFGALWDSLAKEEAWVGPVITSSYIDQAVVSDIHEKIKRDFATAKLKSEEQDAKKLSELTAEKAALEKELSDLSGRKAKHEALSKANQEKLEVAVNALNTAVDYYNKGILDKTEKAEADFLAKHGLTKGANNVFTVWSGSLRRNPQCKAGSNEVFLRIDEAKKKCEFLRPGSQVMKKGLGDEYVKTIKPLFDERDALAEKIGSKSSWGRKATGLRADVAAARKVRDDTRYAAEKKYGSIRNLSWETENLNDRIASSDKQIKQLNSSEAQAERLISDSYLYRKFDKYNAMIKKGRDAIAKEFIVKQDGNIVQDGKIARFDDLGDGYDFAYAQIELILEKRGKRGGFLALEVIDLRGEQHADKDEVVVNISYRGVEKKRDGAAKQSPENLAQYALSQMAELASNES